MSPTTEHLFVYGTLMRDQESPVKAMFQESTDFVTQAWCPGLLYDAGGYPGLVEVEDFAHWVKGEVFRLKSSGTILEHLDKYEECHPSFPQPWEYHRKQLGVVAASGETMDCWVYCYAWDIKDLRLIHSGEWT